MSSKAFALYDLKIKCRSCLRVSQKLISLDKPYNEFAMGKSEFVDARHTIRTIMRTCANVQVEPNDGLPQKVCSKCILSLRAAFNFRRMCELNDIELQKILQEHVSSKKSRKKGDKIKPPKKKCVEQSEAIESVTEEATNNQNTSSELSIINPIVEISLDSNPTFDDVETGIESQEEEAPPELVQSSTAAIEIEACPPPPHSLENENEMTQDDPKQNDDDSHSHDSFEEFEMWENKQKYKRKRIMVEKIRLKKASRVTEIQKPKEKPIQKHICEICSKEVKDIQAHSFVHSAQRIWECDICKRCYKMKGSLSEHMQVHIHGGNIFNYLCPMCGNKYRTSSKLSDHMRLHSDEKQFKCENCGKAFKRKDQLRSHMKSHLTVKPHICSICGKGFSMKGNWKFHMMMHAGERPHKCEICGASFPRQSTLKVHMRGHSGAIPFSCDICGEHFRENRQLTKHRQTCSKIEAE